MDENVEAGAPPEGGSPGRAGVGSEPGQAGPNGRPEGRRFVLGARIAAFAIVIGAAWWLTQVLPEVDIQASYDLSAVAEHMQGGETYPPELLAEIDTVAGPLVEAKKCDYRGLQDLAIIRVARVETAIQANDPEAADQRLTAAADAARRSLTCNPNATVSWTILAWIEFIRNDDTPRLRALLDMSFRTGPFEGWALLRRVELMLHIFPTLDQPGVIQLSSQLNWLLSLGAAEVLAEQYLATGPAQQAYLRDIMATASERDQKRVAELVRQRGSDIVLPLVEPQGSRPWK